MNLILEEGNGPRIMDFLENGDTIVHIVGLNPNELDDIHKIWPAAKAVYDKYMEHAADGVNFAGKLLVVEAKPKDKVNIAYLFWYKNPLE